MTFSALLDTCVLYGSLQRDILLELASLDAYRPVWSNEIERELAEALAKRRGKLHVQMTKEQLDVYLNRLLNQMNISFPDARVDIEAQNPMFPTLNLPDHKDLHVVDAAVIGRADVIVTNNVKDFPEDVLPGSLFVQAPDGFLLDLLSLDPELMHHALKTVSRRTGKKGPKRTVDDIINQLGKSCPMFVQDVKNYLKAIDG